MTDIFQRKKKRTRDRLETYAILYLLFLDTTEISQTFKSIYGVWSNVLDIFSVGRSWD